MLMLIFMQYTINQFKKKKETIQKKQFNWRIRPVSGLSTAYVQLWYIIALLSNIFLVNILTIN